MYVSDIYHECMYQTHIIYVFMSIYIYTYIHTHTHTHTHMYIYDHRRPIVDGGAHVVFGVYERLAVENLLAHVSPKHVGDLCCFGSFFPNVF
jgi:hypothetical protein